MFEATENAIVPHLILDLLKRGANGALVSFIGTVRAYSSKGEKVLFVEFGSDKGRVEEGLWKVGDEIRERWQLEDKRKAIEKERWALELKQQTLQEQITEIEDALSGSE